MSKSTLATKQIDTLLQKAIDEAVGDGVDVSSSEFQKALEELKQKLLKSYGVSSEDYETKVNKLEGKEGKTMKLVDVGEYEKTLKDYEEIKQKLETAVSDFYNKIESLRGEIKGETGEMEKRLKDLVDEVNDKVRKDIKSEFISEIESKVKDKADKEDVFKKDEEIKELADKIEGDREGLKSELNELADDIKNKLGKKVAKEIKTKKEFSKSEKRKLKELMSKDWFNEIQEQINDLTPRLWQGMAMGLKKSISKNSVENLVFNENLSGTVDGSNKDFTLANSPKSGTLVLKDENGVILDEDANDYSISGKTVTLAYPPINKAPKAITYKQ